MAAAGVVKVLCITLIFSCLAFAADPYNPYTYCQAPNKMQATDTSYSLLLVQAFHRHGDRTTLNVLPGINDHRSFFCNLTTFMLPSTTPGTPANVNRLYRKNYMLDRNVIGGDCYFGQLTLRGLEQHINLGANLRDLYVNRYKFLSPNLTNAEVWIRSTDVYRTIQSAQGNVQGLFPADPAVKDIPIIDMYTMDQAKENMVENGAACPRVKQIYNELVSSPEYVKYERSKDDLRAQFAKVMGVPTNTVVFEDLFDAFNVINCYNGALPNGVTQEQVNQVYEIANWEYNYLLANESYVKLTIGQFVAEVIEAINSKIAKHFSQKYLMYSAHDTTIAPLMAAFGVYDGRWPPYASNAQLELWTDAGKEYYVQLKYQGVAQILRGCTNTFCPLQQFIQGVAGYTVNNPKECNAVRY